MGWENWFVNQKINLPQIVQEVQNVGQRFWKISFQNVILPTLRIVHKLGLSGILLS